MAKCYRALTTCQYYVGAQRVPSGRTKNVEMDNGVFTALGFDI